MNARVLASGAGFSLALQNRHGNHRRSSPSQEKWTRCAGDLVALAKRGPAAGAGVVDMATTVFSQETNCSKRSSESRANSVTANYDEALARVILSRWNKTSQADKDAAVSRKRRGQLDPDDPRSFAIYDCLNYQRGHADVFREVYQKTSHFPPRKGERLLVVDIGAGAATVGIALAEAFKRKQRQRLDYLAFDPHPMMHKLGKRILKHCGSGFHSAKYATTLEDINFAGTDRLLFTFSYVAHQQAVADADTEEWASLIRRSVSEVNQDVELIFTTADLSDGVLVDLRTKLEEAKIVRKRACVSVQVRKRFPKLNDCARQVHWRETDDYWRVRAEHWILSA